MQQQKKTNRNSHKTQSREVLELVNQLEAFESVKHRRHVETHATTISYSWNNMPQQVKLER